MSKRSDIIGKTVAIVGIVVCLALWGYLAYTFYKMCDSVWMTIYFLIVAAGGLAASGAIASALTDKCK